MSVKNGRDSESKNKETSKMKTQKHYFRLTLGRSILVGIILPLSMSSKPMERDRFFNHGNGFQFGLVFLLRYHVGHFLSCKTRIKN